MSFFFNLDNQNKTGIREFNSEVLKQRNRQDLLEIEAKLLVLRLIQLRDYGKTNIISVKQDGSELPKLKQLKNKNLAAISVEEIERLSVLIGYHFTCKVSGHAQVFSKVNIEINNKKYGIRCFDHTERPLINHSTRDKFEKLCKVWMMP